MRAILTHAIPALSPSERQARRPARPDRVLAWMVILLVAACATLAVYDG
jgi:hypothetical protein